MPSLLEYKPLVSAWRFNAPLNRETKLEWHVEPRNPRHRSGGLRPREVMERVSAACDELCDSVETPLSAWDLERCSRHEAVRGKAGNEGEIERLIASVVRNVEERVRRSRNRRAARGLPYQGWCRRRAVNTRLRLAGPWTRPFILPLMRSTSRMISRARCFDTPRAFAVSSTLGYAVTIRARACAMK